jgi:hypothetical protein
MRTALTLTSTLLVTLSLHDTQLGQMQSKALLTNFYMRLLDRGILPPS